METDMQDTEKLLFCIHIRCVLYLQHSVVFYEQDGDDMYHFRSQGDLVRVPDPEILQVRISTYSV
jgi:hypothetical protein